MVRPSHSSSSPWPARFWNRQKVPGPLILLAKLDPSFRRLLLRWEAAVEPELVCRPLAELIGGLARSHAPRDGQAAGPQGAGADPQQLDAAIAETLPAPLRHVPRPQRAVLVDWIPLHVACSAVFFGRLISPCPAHIRVNFSTTRRLFFSFASHVSEPKSFRS